MPDQYSRYREYRIDLSYERAKASLKKELVPQGFTMKEEGIPSSFQARLESGTAFKTVRVTQEKSGTCVVRIAQDRPPTAYDEATFWLEKLRRRLRLP